MNTWKSDPAVLWRLLDYEAQQNPSLRRRLTILEVLAQRGFSPWPALVQAVEAVIGPGVFGPSPQTRLWGDMRALRDAGIMIGYSRTKGTEGYYLRLEALPVHVQTVIRQVMRELDFEHLSRIAKTPPDRRVEAVFEMLDLVHGVAHDGRRDR